MKRFALLFVLSVGLLGTFSCTNDEGEPEFEILNPQEENTETGITGASREFDNAQEKQAE